MEVKNLEEFKTLIKRYESITEEEIQTVIIEVSAKEEVIGLETL